MESIEEFDLFVIGGGSGGLAASKEAAILGAKVGLADYVNPTPIGTKWGIGGTCVNVGCIPKKLMHYAGLRYEGIEEYEKFGLGGKIDKKHNWEEMVNNVQKYIKKLNFGYKASLRTNNVKYFNSYASFVDNTTISLKNAKGEEQLVKAKNILVAVGGRPNYDNIPGAKEYCITSDDIFSLKKSPGKTLVIGASYIALECGGFLSALGYDTSIMVRSILLRGFDQDMATRIGDYMAARGTKFINNSVPISFSKSENQVKAVYSQEGKEKSELFDTVLLAIGRYVDSSLISADKIGLAIAKNGKLKVNDNDQTNISNIYSIGDCAEGRPELTPPAIMAGRLLARRLYAGSKILMNYRNIATTVFTPLEYGAVGLSEDDAKKALGEENVIVYHSEFTPLEWNFDLMRGETCYLKIVCDKTKDDQIVGFHILSPNAGEIVQGMSVAMNCGVNKKQLDMTVGIHPTIAEEFIGVKAVKGVDEAKKTGC